MLSMIIVTGAAGFIGSNLVHALNATGAANILAVDLADAPEKRRNLDGAHIVDLIRPEDLLGRLERLGPVECVLHQGACSDTTASDATYVMHTNYHYSVALAQWCIRASVPLVYASSASVYGGGDTGFTEDGSTERPLNLYAESKVLFDRWVRRHAAKERLVGLRYFNVYGPREQHKGRMASVILKFWQQAKAGRRVQLFEGSDAFARDFVWIDDVSAVNLYFAERPERSGIYNVGSGEAHSFADVARLVSARYGVGVEVVPFPDDLRGKYQSLTCADWRKLRDAGWTRPFTTLEHGVRQYLDMLDEDRG